MRLSLLCLALLGLLTQPSLGQPAPARDRDAILAAVTRYFEGMRARDTAIMGSVTHPGAMMVAVRYAHNTATVSRAPAVATNQRIASGSGPGPREWLLNAEVWQGGEIATVWAPYEIHADGKLMHCGYDAFNLVRDGGRWQIAGTIYTARPDACSAIRAIAKQPLPLPEPSAEERRAVMQAVDGFVTSLRTRDTALLVSLFAPGAQWVTASYGERGVSIRRRPALTDVEILKRGAE
ncbi:MAG: nuclear transport factor 2 family protein, partial [Gemmatimonadales bacterium]